MKYIALIMIAGLLSLSSCAWDDSKGDGNQHKGVDVSKDAKAPTKPAATKPAPAEKAEDNGTN
tara:strand:+ start:2396 stop:2584 length:189 start_codon:yes stop_codon:yes gene_type:complete